MLRRSRTWWPVILCAIFGLTVGLIWAVNTPKSYKATVTLFVGSAVSPDSSAAYNLDLFSQQRTLTYTRLTQNRGVAVYVVKKLGLSISPEQLLAKISASPVPKTVLMTISATDSSAQSASDIANTFTTVFAGYVSRLETPGGSEVPSSVVTVVQTAEPPSAPASPNMRLYALIGMLAGALVGIFAKWLLRFFDVRARTSKQVVESVNAPILGVIPRTHRKNRKETADGHEPAYIEAIRKLRVNLLYASSGETQRTIALVAPLSTVSTTATTTSLAAAISATGRSVAVVDADLRSSRMADYIGVANATVGLSAVLLGNAVIEDALVRVPDVDCDVLLAGTPSVAASDALATDPFVKVLAALQIDHDVVLLDTPGVLSFADAAEVGHACDGVLILAQQGKVRLDQLSETAHTLRHVGVNIIGAVLTDVR